MGRKGNKPIYRTSRENKPTFDLDKISNTSDTSKKNQPDSYEQSEYGETIKAKVGYEGEKDKTIKIPYKIISIACSIVLLIGGTIWYFAKLDSDVNYIKEELKDVKRKTEKLSESSVGQEVKITNIDNNLRDMNSEIREMNNKIYNNSKK